MISLELLLIAVCLVGAGFYSGIETGIISIHRMRLEHRIRQGKEKGANLLRGYLDDSDRLLGTTLVGTNLCVVIISVVSAGLAVGLLGEWGEIVSTVVMTPVILVVGEYLPKAWFHSRPLERTGRFVRCLRVSEIVLMPFSKLTIWLASRIVPGSSRLFSGAQPFMTREDLKMFAREGEEGGELSPRERVMIHRVFELSHKRAGQVMIPRTDITAVDCNTPLREFFDKARKAGFTRMPVYDSGSDKFVGIINVFYVLSTPKERYDRPVSDFMRTPLFIGENMPVDDILPQLRHSRQPMCLVTDAAGTASGLITTEDILEEIVGKL